MTDAAGPMRRDTPIDTVLWLDRHGAALRQFFRRRVDPAEVDDLVQDVLLKLQTTASEATIASAERYLFTVARNVLVDRHRIERAHDHEAYESYARIDGIGDPLSPERIVSAREEYARVRKVIRDLPPRARMAFEFHRFEHMPYKEIAVRMRISRESVKELIHRALTAVVAELRESEAAGG